VHADLKPANVLFDAAGQPLLSDFGLVRHIASGSRSGGVGLGTVEYLDPAVAEGAPPSPASDVYSLGVVSYELLAGRLPYRGVTHHDTLRIAERGRLPPLAQTAPRIGAGLATAVEQAMARRPADRPSSAGEMADAIRGARC
jgi:serine/threonine-protein kinase